MRIEFILLGVILLVIAIDFFVKKSKKSSSKEIEKFKESKNDTLKKPAILKWVIISLAVLSLGSLVVYQIVFAPKTYKSAEVTFNNNLAYLKTDMSLLTGKINDSIHKGLFVDGKREGFHKIKYSYFGKDTILNFAEGEFLNNKYVGLWSFYHKNGQLNGKGNYDESKGEKLGSSGIPSDNREGLWRIWYENGQLSQEGNYVNNKGEGLWRYWYENGQLEREGEVISDKLNGLWRYWYENGQLKQEGNYVNGYRDGLWRFWYENGQLEREGNYVNNKGEGLWRYWYENGQLKEESNYVKEKTEGLHRQWFENGQLRQEGLFVDGKAKGLWRFWSENGVRKGNGYF